MAKNFIQPGRYITLPAPAGGVSSGDLVVVGSLVGVATHDAAAGVSVTIDTKGVFTLPADTNLVMAAGDRVFWDTANGWVDKTAALQQCVGRTVEAKLQAGATVKVRLGASTPAAL